MDAAVGSRRYWSPYRISSDKRALKAFRVAGTFHRSYRSPFSFLLIFSFPSIFFSSSSSSSSLSLSLSLSFFAVTGRLAALLAFLSINNAIERRNVAFQRRRPAFDIAAENGDRY